MSTSFEVRKEAGEHSYMMLDEVERNGVGIVYGLLSSQLISIGVYGGEFNGAHRFLGLKIEERTISSVARLKIGFDIHNQDERKTHNDGAKPVVVIGHNPDLLSVNRQDFTQQLIPLITDYLGLLQQNDDLPRRVDQEGLSAQLGLFERIDQGLKDGSLVIDQDGGCNIYSLFERQY